ncbi:MAG: hypothetical protein ACFCBV_07000 [Phycisphaerales bacterium]
MPQGEAKNSKATKRGRLRGRWSKRLAFAAIACLLLALLGAGLVFTPVAGVLIRPKLERELGVETSGGSLRLDLGGDVIIRNVTFSVPESTNGNGPKGDAARFLIVKRGQVLLWWRGKVRGQSLVRRVEVFDADVVLSKPLDDFDLNILGIEPPAPKPGTTPAPLPSIVVHKASVLLGEHNADGDVFELRTLPMVASLRASQEELGAYDVTAFEDPSLSTSRKPLRFQGRLSPTGFSGDLGAIDMADFPPSTIPQQLREAYTELRVSGRTRGATVRYDEAFAVLELVLDVQEASSTPAPFMDDTDIDARLNLRIPVPTDEDGTLRPLIPASGSGLVRLIQRPLPRLGNSVPWERIQAPPEPGESGIGKRSLMVEGVLRSTIEDASASLDVRLWLGGGEPLYEFEVATTEPYRIDQGTPWLARPAPVLEKLSELLDMLGSEGTVSLAATVSQVAEGNGGRQGVQGAGSIRDGAMRFRYFPYPVMGVNGSIEIDDGQIRLTGLRGSTPSGSPVLASTVVSLDQVATGVDVDVRAFGIPYDEALQDTLDEIAPEIREIILNEREYARLMDEGLIRSPGGAGRAPSFALGGEADARVRVTRTPGVMGSTTLDIDVRSTRLGLLPEAFPVPIIGTDVDLNISLPPDLETTYKGLPRLLRISTDDASVTSLAGGDARVAVDITVPIDRTTSAERSTTVDVQIDARDVPIHPPLLAAVPGAGDGDPSGALPRGPRGLLEDLGPSGEIGARVSVVRDANGGLDWSAEILPNNATFQPAAIEARRPFRVLRVNGTVYIDGEGLRGELEGRADRGGQIRSTFRSDFGEESVLAVVTSEALNLESRVEDAVAVFAPEVGRQLALARSEYEVEGVANVVTSVQIRDGTTTAEVRGSAIDRLRFNWLEGRMGIDDGRGSVVVTTTDAGPLITFDRMVANGTYNEEPFGRVRMRGEIPMDALRERGSTYADATVVDLEIQGGSLDSPLLLALASNRGGDGLGALLEAWQVRGEYDALVAIETVAYGGHGPGIKPLRHFELSPYDASIFRHGERFVVPWLSGVVSGQEMLPSEEGPGGATTYSGELDHLTLGGDDWWISLDGYWRSDGFGRSVLEADLDGEIDAPGSTPDRRHGVPTPIFGLAPVAIVRSFDALSLQSDGPLGIENGVLRLVKRPLEELHTRFESEVSFGSARFGSRPVASGTDSEDAVLQGGARSIVELRDGVIRLNSDTEHFTLLGSVGVEAEEGKIWDLSFEDVGLDALIGRDRVIELEDLRFAVGGGRMAGRGRVMLPDLPRDPVGYELDLSGAGLDTERFIAAIQDRTFAGDRSAGDLDLSLGLAGNFGDAQSMRGRGSMRIREGSPVDLPVAIRAAVEALNVNFGAEQYDAMNAEFFVVGETVTFTRLSVSSPSVVLNGLGTVDVADGGLDFAITSRSANETSVGSFFRFLRDVIVGIELRGTLDAPSPAPRPQALLGPFDRLRRVMQGGLTYEEWERERLRRYTDAQGESRSGW